MNTRALIACFVIGGDLLFGAIRARIPLPPGPPITAARLALVLARRLDRPSRSSGTLVIRGLAVVLIIAGSAWAVGTGLATAAKMPPLGFVIDAVTLWGCVRPFRPIARLRAARPRNARKGSTDGDLERVEQAATSFVHFLIVPIFWYLVAGLPGVLTASSCWGLDRAAGRRNGSPAYGLVAHRLEGTIAWLPSRIAELIIAVAAAIVPRGRPAAAIVRAWAPSIAGGRRPAAALVAALGADILPTAFGPPRPIGLSPAARALWLYAGALLLTTAALAGIALT